MQATRSRSSRPATTPRFIATAAVVAAVVGSIAAFVIARCAIALGADSTAQQLQVGAYVTFTVVGVVIGAIGWSIVRRRSAQPHHTMTWLFPATVLVLFVPDILLGLGSSSWGVAGALMVMHVAIAAIALVTFEKFMPLR